LERSEILCPGGGNNKAFKDYNVLIYKSHYIYTIKDEEEQEKVRNIGNDFIRVKAKKMRTKGSNSQSIRRIFRVRIRETRVQKQCD
jgi:hypothetical protein